MRRKALAGMPLLAGMRCTIDEMYLGWIDGVIQRAMNKNMPLNLNDVIKVLGFRAYQFRARAFEEPRCGFKETIAAKGWGLHRGAL